MAESNWKVRMMLFVRAVDNTPANRQSFGEIYANNGSMENVSDESKLFDNAMRLSTTGNTPAQVFGLETLLLLPDMRDDMRTFLDTLPQSRYYVVANIDLPQYDRGELMLANGGSGVMGEPFAMTDALNDLYNERGLQVILDNE